MMYQCILLLIFLVCVSYGRKNILHIVIDDLRTDVGTYLSPNDGTRTTIHTPHIDKLASEGIVFDRAYSQQAVCNPSRASFMTGRRPDSTRVWNLLDNWRVNNPSWTSLPGMFKAAGMKSLGCGKTYHDTVQSGLPGIIHEYDGLRSWSLESLPYANPCYTQGIDCIPCPQTGFSISNVSLDWCVKPEGDLSDVFTTNHAISLLNRQKHSRQPFYLAVGYHKPHLPWIAKPEHYALYPLENITLPRHPTLDPSVPDIAFNDCNQSPTPLDPISDHNTKLARRAYYAATTGMDEQIGRLLDELEKSGMAKDTAVVLHGDHGWHLGEYGEWKKNTNWEIAVRTPLIMRVPWMNELAGRRTKVLAELVDLMPTMADLVGIDVPNTKAGDVQHPIQGVSLLPVLEETGGIDGEQVKKYAFSQYPRCPKSTDQLWRKNGCDHHKPNEFGFMGYSVRIQDWRYTEWFKWDQNQTKAHWELGAQYNELYDHRNDTNILDYENIEVVNVADKFPSIVSTLSSTLKNQFDPNSFSIQ